MCVISKKHLVWKQKAHLVSRFHCSISLRVSFLNPNPNSWTLNPKANCLKLHLQLFENRELISCRDGCIVYYKFNTRTHTHTHTWMYCHRVISRWHLESQKCSALVYGRDDYKFNTRTHTHTHTHMHTHGCIVTVSSRDDIWRVTSVVRLDIFSRKYKNMLWYFLEKIQKCWNFFDDKFYINVWKAYKRLFWNKSLWRPFCAPIENSFRFLILFDFESAF